MFKYIAQLIFAFCFLCGCSVEQVDFNEKGISEALSRQRKGLIREVKYNLEFDIPKLESEKVFGKVKLELSYEGFIKERFLLDFKGDSVVEVRLDSEQVAFTWNNEHIEIVNPEWKENSAIIEIDFIASDKGLNRRSDFLYTLNVPDKASLVYPCFDQPNLKAKYDLKLDFPSQWTAVGNGIRRVENTRGEFKTATFSTTEKISSYLFAFAVGEFTEVQLGENNAFHIYHRETDSTLVEANIKVIHDLHVNSIAWMEQYTGIDYPFDNFEIVLIPSFQFGGMEHPGNIFYSAEQLFLPEGSTENQKLRRASLIAHETAHMWFGDLVTMEWFNDVWLKEVFANFMASKIIHPQFKEVNHSLNFLMRHYPSAYAVDRTAGTHPIQQSLSNMNKAANLYGAIIYQKAPIAMLQLEKIVGKEKMQKGLQTYLKEFAFENATWDDLIAILSKESGLELNKWSEHWIKKEGMVNWTTTVNANSIVMEQTGELDSTHLLPQVFEIGVFHEQGNTTYKVNSESRSTAVPIREATPSIVLPNTDGLGFGFFAMDSMQLEYFQKFNQELDVVARGAGWINVYENYLHGRIGSIQYVEWLKKSVLQEKNPLILNYQIGNLRTVFWNHIKNKTNTAKSIESILLTLFINTEDEGLKRIYYEGLRGLVYTKAGVEVLHAIWSDQLSVNGLSLREYDYMNLSLDLALHGHKDSEQILQTQASKIKNKDRQEEYAFLRKSVVSTPEERKEFFAYLSNSTSWKNETWVLRSMYYFNHALHANENIVFLNKGLELTVEMEKSGSIFFPKRWLDALLQSQNSLEASQAIEIFLKENENFPENLRKKVLQSSDMSRRSQSVILKSN